MKKIKSALKKTAPKERRVLLGAALVFLATFLPWSSSSFGMLGGFSYNGWHSAGMLSVLSSAGLILLWLLPHLGFAFKLPLKKAELQKYLLFGMLAGPLIWWLQAGFSFAYSGLGFWLALVASALTLFGFYKK